MRWCVTGSGLLLLLVGFCDQSCFAVARLHQRHARGAVRLHDRRTVAKELDRSVAREDPMDRYFESMKSAGMKVPTIETAFDAPSVVSQASVPVNTTADQTAIITVAASQPRQHVVVAKYDEDVSWLKNLPSNLDVVVYQSKDPAAPHFVENVGNEASKYLSYIVENYDALPDTVVFVQAGRADWHDPVDKDTTLSRWNWDAAASRGGIAFLPTAAPCLIEDSEPQGADMDAGADEAKQKRRAAVPLDEMCVDIVEHSPPQMETVRSVWPDVFESELGPLPKHWFTHCCGQFQVTGDAIRQHPLDFYQRLLRWTMDHDRSLMQSDYGQEMKRGHDKARRDSGHVLEVTWALIFSDPMSRITFS